MKQTFTWMVPLVLAFTLTLSTGRGNAQAGPGPGGPQGSQMPGTCMAAGPDDEGAIPGMANLDLTPEQINQLKQDKSARQKQMIKLRADMEALHIDLRDETDQEKPDQKKIEKITKQIGEIHAQIIMERIQSVLFLKSILTPEQKKKWSELQLHHLGGPKHDMMMHEKGKGKF